MFTQFRTILVPALALAALASMTGSAYADHVTEHTVENLKGGLKALDDRDGPARPNFPACP